MNAPDFEQWLLSRNIDVQSMTKEMWAALQGQFECEQRRNEPPAVTLVMPVDCSWPQRTYRSEVVL